MKRSTTNFAFFMQGSVRQPMARASPPRDTLVAVLSRTYKASFNNLSSDIELTINQRDGCAPKTTCYPYAGTVVDCDPNTGGCTGELSTLFSVELLF
jgi:hypothetical protein